jgi:hypothetical protein
LNLTVSLLTLAASLLVRLRVSPRGALLPLLPVVEAGGFATLLLVVEDSFDIRGRGLIVVPGPHADALERPSTFRVELHLPDGTRREARAILRWEFSLPSPPASQRRYTCILEDVSRPDVPPGTEVWFLRAQ